MTDVSILPYGFGGFHHAPHALSYSAYSSPVSYGSYGLGGYSSVAYGGASLGYAAPVGVGGLHYGDNIGGGFMPTYTSHGYDVLGGGFTPSANIYSSMSYVSPAAASYSYPTTYPTYVSSYAAPVSTTYVSTPVATPRYSSSLSYVPPVSRYYSTGTLRSYSRTQERLKDLKQLLDDELITEDEFKQKREAILELI
jgi:hypothetical protein